MSLAFGISRLLSRGKLLPNRFFMLLISAMTRVRLSKNTRSDDAFFKLDPRLMQPVLIIKPNAQWMRMPPLLPVFPTRIAGQGLTPGTATEENCNVRYLPRD